MSFIDTMMKSKPEFMDDYEWLAPGQKGVLCIHGWECINLPFDDGRRGPDGKKLIDEGNKLIRMDAEIVESEGAGAQSKGTKVKMTYKLNKWTKGKNGQKFNAGEVEARKAYTHIAQQIGDAFRQADEEGKKKLFQQIFEDKNAPFYKLAGLLVRFEARPMFDETGKQYPRAEMKYQSVSEEAGNSEEEIMKRRSKL